MQIFLTSLLSTVSASLFDVTQYGAVGDGQALDSPAISKAFEACASAGGGTVLFPAGIYLTKPFNMSCNNSVIVISPHAVLRAAMPHADFPFSFEAWPLGPDCIEPNSKGTTNQQMHPFMLGSHLNNVTLTGGGVVDGAGQMWWEQTCKSDRNYFCPDDERKQLLAWRPYLMRFDHCTNILVDNVTLQNSSFWTMVLTRSKNVEVRHSRIFAPQSSPNTDGIEPMESSNIHIHDCNISNGDNAVVVKAGSSDVVVENCRFIHSNGATVGSIWDLDVSNVTYRNIYMQDSKHGLRVKGRAAGSARISNIHFSNIQVDGADTAISIDMFYKKGDGTNKTHCVVEDVLIENVFGSATRAGEFNCWKERPCHGIHLFNINVSASESDWTCTSAEVVFANGTLPLPKQNCTAELLI